MKQSKTVKQAGLALTAVLWSVAAGQADDVRDYGEYLSGDCMSCHSLYKSNKGLRKLAGWRKDVMINVIHAYKSGDGDNDTMLKIAASLDDEQINAIAVYLETIRK